jgi:hypothetical protein
VQPASLTEELLEKKSSGANVPAVVHISHPTRKWLRHRVRRYLTHANNQLILNIHYIGGSAVKPARNRTTDWAVHAGRVAHGKNRGAAQVLYRRTHCSRFIRSACKHSFREPS